MGSRVSRLSGEIAKFLTVGGVATVVALIIFNVLVHGTMRGEGVLNSQPLIAYFIANTLSTFVSYRGSRSWAFQSREVVGSGGGRLRFFSINIASLLIPMACLTVSRYLLGLDDPVSDNISANGVGLVLGTAARYLAFRRFIFVNPSRRLALEEAAEEPAVRS